MNIDVYYNDYSHIRIETIVIKETKGNLWTYRAEKEKESNTAKNKLKSSIKLPKI